MSEDRQQNQQILPKLQELASRQEQEKEQEQEDGDDDHELQVHEVPSEDHHQHQHHHQEEEEECKTPTSSDHKIPSIQTCPPTPRKKAHKSFLHKRKLPELEFFEASNKDEVDSFFRSNFEMSRVESRSIKRRCKSY
ncbi:cyclin-dependent protein kinase inhibitor SMR2 [Ricinus communis]|uniref:cyclin-dependent protein kinase inhibitor SMR2 n=1 Tax=Ricinus communis TaxID=3988 RepID=UPI00201A3805|nr:cyclin-dependent protein kinase inhibitor SMR2 [Ricinus communis]